MPERPTQLAGLIVDWGGVLTAPLDEAMTEWARLEGIDFAQFRAVMADWVGSAGAGPALSGGASSPGASSPGASSPGASSPGAGSSAALTGAELTASVAPGPVHALERGELATGEFEAQLAEALRARGAHVQADGLLTRMLAGLADTRDDMVNLLRRARGLGIRTALLSNSWGEHYPEHAWVGAFDAVVISGRVGMRKPDADIFQHTADLLGLPPARCVFVDDLQRNVAGAVAVGMVGVLHTDFEQTLAELEIVFERSLG